MMLFIVCDKRQCVILMRCRAAKEVQIELGHLVLVLGSQDNMSQSDRTDSWLVCVACDRWHSGSFLMVL